MVIKIPREKIKKIDIVNIKGGLTATQVYKKYKPDYMINLALYDMASGTNITHLKDEGVASGYLFSNEGIGIKGDAELIWTTKDDNSVRDYVSGSPVLLKNGLKYLDWGNKKSDYICGSHNRSAIGFNSQEMMLYTSNEELTLNELQDALIWHGFDYAINCDGGSSCHLQEGEKIYTKSVRSNASWLLIYGMEVKNMPKVFIGVGHGGNDSGAVANGLREADINLNIAVSCADELIRHGVEVKLSRYKDENDPVEEEVRECNNYNPDIAIDIHTNAGGGDGFEVYRHSGGHNSLKLAQFIEEEARLLNNSRGIKTRLNSTGKDYYAFIRDTNPPAIIVETAFIDNKEDVKVIDTAEKQKAFGIAYAKGILKYFGIEYKEGKDINVATKNEVADTNVGELVLKIGQKSYTVNGEKKEIEVAPYIQNGRTMVPVAVLRDAGCEVIWDGTNQTVTIINKK